MTTPKRKTSSLTWSTSTSTTWISLSLNKSTDTWKWLQASTVNKSISVTRSSSSFLLTTLKNSCNTKCTIKLSRFWHLSKPCPKSKSSATPWSPKHSSSPSSKGTPSTTQLLWPEIQSNILPNIFPLTTRKSSNSSKQTLHRPSSSTKVSNENQQSLWKTLSVSAKIAKSKSRSMHSGISPLASTKKKAKP